MKKAGKLQQQRSRKSVHVPSDISGVLLVVCFWSRSSNNWAGPSQRRGSLRARRLSKSSDITGNVSHLLPFQFCTIAGFKFYGEAIEEVTLCLEPCHINSVTWSLLGHCCPWPPPPLMTLIHPHANFAHSPTSLESSEVKPVMSLTPISHFLALTKPLNRKTSHLTRQPVICWE